MASHVNDEIAGIAKLEFEPWRHTEDEWSPPSNVDWADLANPHLVNARIAWISMYKTKAELVEVVRGLEDSGIAEELLDGLAGSKHYFQGYTELIDGAEARLISAACALACETTDPAITD